MTLPILHPYRVVQLPALSLGLRRDVFRRCSYWKARNSAIGKMKALQVWSIKVRTIPERDTSTDTRVTQPNHDSFTSPF